MFTVHLTSQTEYIHVMGNSDQEQEYYQYSLNPYFDSKDSHYPDF